MVFRPDVEDVQWALEVVKEDRARAANPLREEFLLQKYLLLAEKLKEMQQPSPFAKSAGGKAPKEPRRRKDDG